MRFSRWLFLILALTLAAAAQKPHPAPVKPAAASPQQPVTHAVTNVISAPGSVQPPRPDYKFPNNQTLVYTAEWRLWTAGTATLRMEPSGAQQKVSGAADSTGFVSLLYHVHDLFEAYFDPKTFCSAHLYKHTEEGFRRLDTNIQFEGARKVAVLDEKNLKTGASKHQENEMPACVTDVLSGLFYVGALPLVANAEYNFPLNDGGKTIYAKVKVEGVEDIQTDAGKFHAIRVQLSATSGTLKDRGQVWIWYDEATRVPVQMRGRLFWGTLTLRLSRIDRK